MDVTITQASLHHVLRLAARAVPAHATLPILQHFLLEAGPNGLTVSATDTEVAVVTTAP
ncbi:MAG: DNA polymerase III subunit beta, partial [Chloroflexota bacterium]